MAQYEAADWVEPVIQELATDVPVPSVSGYRSTNSKRKFSSNPDTGSVLWTASERLTCACVHANISFRDTQPFRQPVNATSRTLRLVGILL